MGNRAVTACGSCGDGDLAAILDLGMQPLAERESEPYPLKLLRCRTCSLIQLSFQADQHEMFPQDHPYATGNTAFLREHFSGLARQLAPYAPDDYDVIADIGANDGTLLAAYPDWHPLIRVAVEPTGQAAKCRQRGLRTFQDFFTSGVARLIVSSIGQAKVITACNVLAHVPDPHDFLEGVRILLAPGGIFVTENHDVASVLHRLQIDTIYHEHLRYYSIASLSYLLSKHGLDAWDTESIPVHGGSFRTWARHEARQQTAPSTVSGLRRGLPRSFIMLIWQD
jgi:Putative zinc binding domain/Methyltransferase domain